MDTKATAILGGIVVLFILMLVFRNKITPKYDQCLQRLSNWLPKGFMHWLSDWWSYLKKNTRRIPSFLWDLLQSYSVLAFLFSSTLGAWYLYSSHGKPFSLEGWGAIGALSIMLGLLFISIMLTTFFLMYLAFFILSLFPKGRKIADKFFKFTTPTKLEALEKRVGKLEALSARLEKIEELLNKQRITRRVSIHRASKTYTPHPYIRRSRRILRLP